MHTKQDWSSVVSIILRHAVLVMAIVFVWTVIASPAAQAQTLSVIHNFTGGGDGANPEAGMTLRGGSLYGTAFNGGDGDMGTVYQMTRRGSNWFISPISLFSAGGSNPSARIVFGPDGYLYSTTVYGSGSGGGVGTVFNLIPPLTVCKTANCFWKESVLHSFVSNPDGANPGYGNLIWDKMGNIYGTTFEGGHGVGTVYEVTYSANTWTEMPIYSFSGPDGSFPESEVTLDSKGNLFGTTTQGGLYGYGIVFELTYVVGVGWQETIIYNFQNSNDGASPVAGLILDNSGNLYGAASDGGIGGGGTVFELTPSGKSWQFTLLYSFSRQQGVGCGPRASLTMDATGSLYGTTICGGANNSGRVFKLSNTQNGWMYTSLHDFTGGSDGALPNSNVTIDVDGTLYGTASFGGSQNVGVAWMIKP